MKTALVVCCIPHTGAFKPLVDTGKALEYRGYTVYYVLPDEAKRCLKDMPERFHISLGKLIHYDDKDVMCSKSHLGQNVYGCTTRIVKYFRQIFEGAAHKIPEVVAHVKWVNPDIIYYDHF